MLARWNGGADDADPGAAARPAPAGRGAATGINSVTHGKF